MNPTREDMARLLDGELSPAEYESMCAALADDGALQDELLALMQLELLADAARQSGARSDGRPANRRGRVVPLRRRRRRTWAAAGALAVAAAVVLAWFGLRRGAPSSSSSSSSLAQYLAADRGVEARFTHPALAAHRPYAPVRSGAGEASASEPIPMEALAALERRGDRHALGAALAVEGSYARAEGVLASATRTPDVDSDRAAVALLSRDPQKALRLLDSVLEQAPDHAAAWWNRALVLESLGLPATAATAFEHVAALGEPGWAGEARARADALRDELASGRDQWKRALSGGVALASGAGVLDSRVIEAQPGIARLHFYDAVRVAPTAGAVRALAQVARDLDRVHDTDVHSRLIEQVAGRDFAVRGPLAAQYAQIKAMSPAQRSAYLARLRHADQPDLLLGALYVARRDGADVEEFAAVAARANDPWFDDLAELWRAQDALAAGDTARAESVLLRAVERCDAPGPRYRCFFYQQALGKLYLEQYRFVAALRHTRRAWERAVREGLWDGEVPALMLLGEAMRIGGQFELARAHLEEAMLRWDDPCDAQPKVLGAVAAEWLVRGRTDRAAQTIAELPTCDKPPPLQVAEVFADLARLTGEMRYLDAAQQVVSARESGSPGEALLGRHLRARARLGVDAAASRAELTAVAADAGLHPNDPAAAVARGASYSLLIWDAIEREHFDAAMDLAAAELELAAPTRCAVTTAQDVGRSAVVVRGSDGRAHGVVTPGTPGGVDANQRERLADCDVVDVLARSSVPVTGDLLPARFAWRFRSRRVGSGVQAQPSPWRWVVIHDARPPAGLGLAHLLPWRLGAGTAPPEAELRGLAATPDRALDAMRDASFIELHAHGLVDLSVSDASFVALSPDARGDFALTAHALRHSEPLRGSPVVVLGACHAALPTGHSEVRPWSLPAAFLAAGARAVIASPDSVPDADANRFVAGVRERIRTGAAPVIALRDEKLVWTAQDPHTWVTRFVLFE